MIRSLAVTLLLWLSLSAVGQSGDPPSPNSEAHSLSLCAAPAAVNFGKIGLHFLSAPAFVTITNCGKMNLVIDRVSTTNSREFTDIDGCPLQPLALPPTAVCTVGVRFSPDVEGSSHGDLLIGAEKDKVTVNLFGTGVASTTNLSTTHVVFLPQLLGTQSKTGTVMIRNGSTEHALRMDSVKVEGEFILARALVPCAVPGDVGTSATCNLAVSFAPRTLGSLDGRLIINDSDPASPHVVGLHGTGKGIEISPTQLTWDRTVVGAIGDPKEFKIRAVGEHAIQIGSIKTHGDFEQHNSCGKELHAGTSCTVTVAFRPTESGKRVGSVSIIDSDPTKVQSVFLIGRGAVAAFLPPALVFEPQKTGTTSAPQTVTLKNYGNNSLGISSIDVGGDFAVQAKTCSERLQAGQSCAISVAFLPTRSGVLTGFVAVHESGDRAPVKVNLTGSASEAASQSIIPHD